MATDALAAYHAAREATAAARQDLDRCLAYFDGFLRDLESAAHHLSFHADGTYTRGEACTFSLESTPSLQSLIDARLTWEAARDNERNCYSALSASQRVALAASPAS